MEQIVELVNSLMDKAPDLIQALITVVGGVGVFLAALKVKEAPAIVAKVLNVLGIAKKAVDKADNDNDAAA